MLDGGRHLQVPRTILHQRCRFTHSAERNTCHDLAGNCAERAIRTSDQAITLTFPGVNPHFDYDVQLTFLSDADNRVVQISVGATVLEEHLALPKNRLFKPHWKVPDAACASGVLLVTVKKVSGPNAVLSGACSAPSRRKPDASPNSYIQSSFRDSHPSRWRWVG